MRKFLYKAGIFLAGLIVINLLLYYFISKPVLYDEYLPQKKKLIQYHKFLFSDSHGYVVPHIYLENLGIFNFSYGSDTYVDMYFKLDYLYRKELIPDTILITADDHTLSKYRSEFNNKDRSIRYSSFKSYKKFYDINFLSYIYNKYLKIYLPMLNSNNSQLFQRYIKSLISPENQIVPQWEKVKNKEQECIDRKEYQFPNDSISVVNRKGLMEIISLTNEYGTELIGIKFPLTGDFLKVLENANYKADSIIHSIGSPVYDYKFKFHEMDTFFYDQDHIDSAGSRVFVKMLYDDILNPTK